MTPTDSAHRQSWPEGARAPRYGKWAVLGLLSLALLLSVGNLAYQWSMSRKTLDYYGTENGWLVVNGESVTALELSPMESTTPGATAQRLQVGDKHYAIEKHIDVTQARGIKHIRQALVTDTGFLWPPATDVRPTWRYALQFRSAGKEFVLLFSEDCLHARSMHSTQLLRIRPAEPKDEKSATARAGESPFLAFFRAQFDQ